ncbi:MAG: endonuclease/exonuclease/phosphatase family protein [Flavobacterium sp.]
MSFYNKILLLLITITSFTMQAQSVSAMTFNIRYDNPDDNENAWKNRKEALVDLIQYYHPDFLGIQEGLDHQVHFIQKQLSDYKYIGVGREDGAKKGEYSAIFYDTSRFELLHQETFWLSDTPEKISIGWDAAMERICTYGKFKNKNTNEVFYVFNAHFDHIGVLARKNAARLVLEKIKNLGLTKEKIIVMGDFNSEPDSEPIAIFKKELDYGLEKTTKKFYGPQGTFNDFDPAKIIDKRLDYIFTKNCNVFSYRHIDDKRVNNLCVSDHFPVLITLK